MRGGAGEGGAQDELPTTRRRERLCGLCVCVCVCVEGDLSTLSMCNSLCSSSPLVSSF